jgi:hypothetical protein
VARHSNLAASSSPDSSEAEQDDPREHEDKSRNDLNEADSFVDEQEYDQEDDFDSEDFFCPPAMQVEAEFSTDGVFQRASQLSMDVDGPRVDDAGDSSIIEHGKEEDNPFVTDSSLLLPDSVGRSIAQLDDGSLDLRDVCQSLDLDQNNDERRDLGEFEEGESIGLFDSLTSRNYEDERGVSIMLAMAELASMTPQCNLPVKNDILEQEHDVSFDIEEGVERKSLAVEMQESLSFEHTGPVLGVDADDEAEEEYSLNSYSIVLMALKIL